MFGLQQWAGVQNTGISLHLAGNIETIAQALRGSQQSVAWQMSDRCRAQMSSALRCIICDSLTGSQGGGVVSVGEPWPMASTLLRFWHHLLWAGRWTEPTFTQACFPTATEPLLETVELVHSPTEKQWWCLWHAQMWQGNSTVETLKLHVLLPKSKCFILLRVMNFYSTPTEAPRWVALMKVFWEKIYLKGNLFPLVPCCWDRNG